MKNLNFSRFIAYLIDFVLVGVIASLFAFIPFFQSNRNYYNDSYQKIIEVYEKLEKNEISQGEYQEEYISLSYDLNRSNMDYMIINMVVLIGYFGIFQWQREGQTIGKKIMKIKVVSNDSSKKLTWVNYLVRTVILNNIIITSLQLIVLFVFSKEQYYTIYTNINLVGYILVYVTLFMVFVRKDKRGLHDIIAGTKVVLLEKKEEVLEAKIIDQKEEKEKHSKKAKKSA